jgi:hypothetical protein
MGYIGYGINIVTAGIIHQVILMGGKPSVDVSYIGEVTDTANLTTYTFSGASIGAVDATRKTVIAVVSRTAGTTITLNSATIGGSAATALVNAKHSSGNTQHAALFIIDSGSGSGLSAATTADITVTFSSAATRCAVGVYRLTNSSITAHDTDQDGTTSGNPTGGGIDVQGAGAIIAAGGCDAPGAATTSWSNLTEDADARLESAMLYSWASAEFASSQTALNIDPTFSTPGVENLFVAASFNRA